MRVSSAFCQPEVLFITAPAPCSRLSCPSHRPFPRTCALFTCLFITVYLPHVPSPVVFITISPPHVLHLPVVFITISPPRVLHLPVFFIIVSLLQGRQYPVLLTRVMFDCLMSQWGITIRFSKSAANTVMSSMLLLVSPHSCRPVMCAANSLQVPCIASST